MGVDRSHAPGDTVAGYVVEGLAGRGGMGEVYRARDPRLDRPVALKLLSPALAEDARLPRASRRASRGSPPRSTTPTSCRSTRPARPTGACSSRCATSRAPTCGAAARAGRARPGAGARPSPPRSPAPSTPPTRAASSTATSSPRNVLIDQADGREHAYLADFGLTQSAAERGPADGQLMGTLDYVAPEQIRGDEVDGRADVYALGCLLFETLTGTLPFAGVSDVALIYAHLEDAAAASHGAQAGAAGRRSTPSSPARWPRTRPIARSAARTLVSELEDALGLRPTGRDLLRRRLPGIGIAARPRGDRRGGGRDPATQGAAPAAAAPAGSVVRIDPETNAVAGRFPVGRPRRDRGGVGARLGRAARLRTGHPGEPRVGRGPPGDRHRGAAGRRRPRADGLRPERRGGLRAGCADAVRRADGAATVGHPRPNCSIAASRDFGIAAAPARSSSASRTAPRA